MTRRLRVLVEAYECSPGKSHVPGSAWQILMRLSQWFDLWILTEQTQYAADILQYVRSHPKLSSGIHFHYIPRKAVSRKHGKRPTVPVREMLAYRSWLRQAYHYAKELHFQVGFDLVHHLRADTFREPGYLWKLGLPFVWGPTGGTNEIPWRLFPFMHVTDWWSHMTRNLITRMQLYRSPRIRQAAWYTNLLIPQTEWDRRSFRRAWGITGDVVHEQACEEHSAEVHQYDGKRKLNVAWVGRCVASKALPILLRALGGLGRKDQITVHIAGDGPCQTRWKKSAEKYGVADMCRWYGWLCEAEIQTLLSNCDVLVFTSLLEATSTTVMQALSWGLPIVCLDHCGFSDIIDPQCGIKIPITSCSQITHDLSSAIQHLLTHPSQIEMLSRGALQKARQYTWDKAAFKIRQAYLNTYGTPLNEWGEHDITSMELEKSASTL
ncbi:MAG: glycosyltransferase family 4 protein [Sedimentisphaerales bacterium]|nr:glycosyltransferase family 4 protein [Sedimentisphaerales bacterium]